VTPKEINNFVARATSYSDQEWQKAIEWIIQQVEICPEAIDGIRKTCMELARMDDPLRSIIGSFALVGISEAALRAGKHILDSEEEKEGESDE
jgi:hypothetical protein